MTYLNTKGTWYRCILLSLNNFSYTLFGPKTKVLDKKKYLLQYSVLCSVFTQFSFPQIPKTNSRTRIQETQKTSDYYYI